MAGYVYGGVEIEGIDHGTNRGYYQHRRKDAPMCDPCRLAHNAAQREHKRARVGSTRSYNWPAKCGTDGGYTKHRNNGENPCIACKVAHSEAEMVRYRRSREGVEPKRAPNDTRHGTPGGYRKHIRLRTVPCEPCRLAHNADATARRRAKAA